MTIKEARQHLRQAIKELQPRSVELKKLTRGAPHDSDAGRNMAALAENRRRLTVLYAMLAYTRNRIHPVTKQGNIGFLPPSGDAERDALRYVRWYVETRGESILGAWWRARQASVEGCPSLAGLWGAISLIPDVQARTAAVLTAGPEAGYRC